MNLGKPTDRRQFLKHLALLLGSSACGPLTHLWAPNLGQEAEAAGKRYRLAPWSGDDFTLGHRLRENEIPACPKDSQAKVDFVIVGGGMAGLTSAYYLRNHNFLLLEQYGTLGGNSIGSSYRGISYSMGAAYMGSNDGIFGQLFDDIAIKPVQIPPTKNSWWWEGSWLPGIKGSDQSSLYKQFAKLIEECKPVWDLCPKGEPYVPLKNAQLEKLDSTNFASFLNGYDAQFISIVESFCKSAFCGGISQLSALSGILLMQDLVSPSYVFKGGNPAIARALADKIKKTGKGRTVKGAFVWRVNVSDSGASVVYQTSDGSLHKVDCKHVIVTTPPLVSGRIIPNLDDKAKSLLLWNKFGSYLVANFCMRKKVFDGAYDNWVGSPFTFADFTIAETPYIATGTYKKEMGSVLTVYQPYSNASPGRALLLAGDRQQFAGSLVEQLGKIVPQFEKNLEEVVLTRWGHAMIIARPGFFGKLAQLQALDTGRLSLAHNSAAGLPSAESAIIAAARATDRALGKRPKA